MLSYPFPMKFRTNLIYPNITNYLESCLYVSYCVQINMCYFVNFLARCSRSNDKFTWKILNAILSYLKLAKLDLIYLYENKSFMDFKVQVWTDESFADDLSTQKSTIGHFVLSNKCLVSWGFIKTANIVLPTYKAELDLLMNPRRLLFTWGKSTKKFSEITWYALECWNPELY